MHYLTLQRKNFWLLLVTCLIASSFLGQATLAQGQAVAAVDEVPQVHESYTWRQDSAEDWLSGSLEHLQSGPTPGSLQLAKRYFGEEMPVGSPEDQATLQNDPVLGTDAAGNVFALWVDWRNGQPDIYFTYQPAGGSWEASLRVNDDTGTAIQDEPDLVVDSLGNAYAVWRDERNGSSDLYFAYRPAGGSWSANQPVSKTSPGAEPVTPSIGADPSGNVIVLWEENDNGRGYIYSAYRPAGGSWQAPTHVDDAGNNTPRQAPRVAMDGQGNAYAAWLDQRLNKHVYFSYRPAGGSWGVH